MCINIIFEMLVGIGERCRDGVESDVKFLIRVGFKLSQNMAFTFGAVVPFFWGSGFFTLFFLSGVFASLIRKVNNDTFWYATGGNAGAVVRRQPSIHLINKKVPN